ncbi:hypothetical protein MTR67_043231 [Solanum verrucosum]|uniref:DUF4218 domain-containing protein n=1 Tax=Solanum verrucosum TaxID=315347 RepID=A0AAF0ZSH3_SOLVR|nr:hypothetical protein MTR67_043231 [Solanum verrucosum]
MEVKNQLEEERKNREVMEVRLVHDQKLLKESMMALVSHLQNPKNGLPASIFNIITTSTSSNETSFASLMNNNWQNLEMAIYDCDKFSSLCNEKDAELKVALTEKRNLEMRLPKLSSQGSKKTIPKELADANNQRVLPIALRGFLNKDVSLALIELGHFFQRLCCKTLRKDDLEQLERDIIIILCKLEMIFPPAFFDVMVHLAVHLPREAMYGGPVQYRWMYKIERFLCKLKRYVRNKARPEGSIAEGYIIDECLTFCSMYLTDIETRFNREHRNDDGSSSKDELVLDIFSNNSKPFRDGIYDVIPKKDFDMARWYHVQRCDELRKSQNCGIVVVGYHENEVIDFYGIIVDILELEYVEEHRVLLFKCKWFDLRKKTGMRKDNNFTKKENSKAESAELHIANDEVYQDISLENNSIVNDSVEILCQLHRDDIDSVTLDANVIELESQTQYAVEIDYSDDDCNQEDDTIIEYISDHEENEGNNSTNDDEVDSTFDGDDIGF